VRDGANRTLNRLVGFLERQNVAVRVYAPTVPEPAFPPTGTLVSVPSVALPRRKEYRLGLGLTSKVVADLKAFRPTMFHLSAPDLIGYSALKLARRWRLPVVASYHTRFESYLGYYGLSWLEPAITQYLRYFYGRCKHLYVPTTCMAERLNKQGFGDDIRVWSRGIDRERFNPTKRSEAWRASLGIAPDDVTIAFVGRLVLEKGLDLLCDIAGALDHMGAPHKLLIVGDGPEQALLRQRLPRAVFTGHLDGDALERAYASADMFLNPSTTETFGNVTLEAMASGLPTVCAQATGSNAIVRHEITGYLIAADQPQSFALCLARMIKNADMRRGMGEAGREASRNFDWERIMASLLAHYREALTDGSTPTRASPALRINPPLLLPQEQAP
jgi:glycosyltransferase involved in cell wall biosynthesis